MYTILLDVMYIVSLLHSLFQTKPELSLKLILVFVRPCILNQGRACWLFKERKLKAYIFVNKRVIYIYKKKKKVKILNEH